MLNTSKYHDQIASLTVGRENTHPLDSLSNVVQNKVFIGFGGLTQVA